MCLDGQILSAWADGEVPAPWDERVREHVESCPRCKAVVERHRALGASLRGAEAAAPSDAELAAAKERVWARVEARMGETRFPRETRRRGLSMLTRALAVPLPLAAAAAAAFIVVSGALVSAMNQNQALRAAVFTSNEIPARTAQPVGMESFMRYLEDQNAQLTITVNLPGETKLETIGKPVIMKASGGQE